MPTRLEWLNQLRSYIGTPFQHQGRNRNGLDCIGLLAIAADDLGIDSKAKLINGYAPAPDTTLFEKRAGEFLSPLPYNRLQALRGQLEPGDVMLFWIDKRDLPRHIAVFAGYDSQNRPTMIHSYAKKPRTVVEMPMELGFWKPRLCSIWQVPGLEN